MPGSRVVCFHEDPRSKGPGLAMRKRCSSRLLAKPPHHIQHNTPAVPKNPCPWNPPWVLHIPPAATGCWGTEDQMPTIPGVIRIRVHAKLWPHDLTPSSKVHRRMHVHTILVLTSDTGQECVGQHLQPSSWTRWGKFSFSRALIHLLLLLSLP